MRKVPLRPDGIGTPLVSRLSPTHRLYDVILAEHHKAIDEGRSAYLDPISGLSVFTSRFLAERGYCCDSGCRHCPYQT